MVESLLCMQSPTFDPQHHERDRGYFNTDMHTEQPVNMMTEDRMTHLCSTDCGRLPSKGQELGKSLEYVFPQAFSGASLP